MSSSEEITRRSNSNLAFALACLPPQRRRDMISFYSFCRIIDDIADEPGIPKQERRDRLQLWSEALSSPEVSLSSFQPEEKSTVREMREILSTYRIEPKLPNQIIEGVSLDIDEVTFQTHDELQDYCYLVASVVGLVSIEIMGYQNPSCRDYAVELGHSLQLINILRDVGEDQRNEGRIYLPLEEIEAHGYSEEELRQGRHTPAFLDLASAYAKKALRHRENALSHLDPADRSSMYCPEIMAETYLALLRVMQKDEFRVFEQRYRLSKLRRGGIFLAGMIPAWLSGSRKDPEPVRPS